MSKLVTYFPRTTAQQRYLVFETWEATGSVTAACRQARVTRKVFYTWKPRFEAGGYENGGAHETSPSLMS